MQNRKMSGFLVVVPLVTCLLPGSGRAETAEVLKEITDTAEKICGTVAQAGSSNSVEVKGDVKVELNGLFRRLADLGMKGIGTINQRSYEGLVQEQIPDALRNIMQCRLIIFDTLQKKLLADLPRQPPRNPNALYQYGEQVADVQGAFISRANGIVTFEFLHTSGKADPTREVEYQNWALSCPDLPAPRPKVFVGHFSGVVAGEKCTILRKLN